MVRSQRLVLLIAVSAVLGLASAVAPGRAQAPLPTRFAFADTTLLRDTLDLKFDGLFELSDSLRVRPDTLRALSIRYLFPLKRLAFLADSMRMPVDSVGPVLERERYNPLAALVERETIFTYGSTYNIGRQNTSWTNTTDYKLVRGALFTRNVTNVQITRTKQVGGIAEYHSRNSNTETGWRLTPNFSVGGRVNLRRTDNSNPSSISRSIQNDEYQFSLRTRQEPVKGLSSTVDVFGGPYDEPTSVPARRGLGGQIVGSIAYLIGDWMTNDVSVQLTRRAGRARQPARPWIDTDEQSRSLQGTLNLFAASPVGTRVGYSLDQNLRERPTTVGTGPSLVDQVSREESYGNGLDMDLRFRGASDRQLTFSGNLSSVRSFLELSRVDQLVYEPSTHVERMFAADGRYGLLGWVFDARFSVGRPGGEGPAQGLVARPSSVDTTVDYRERDRAWTREASATVSKNLTRRLVVKCTGSVALNSYRYTVVDTSYRAVVGEGYVTPTTPREDYRQSYRIETSYSAITGFSTGLELEVSRSLNLYLTGNRSAQSAEDRVYRAVWHWTHRLLRGLTVTQRNQMSATYRNTPLAADIDALSLGYLTITTLNAIVTSRLSVDLTHSRNIRPRGDFLGEVNEHPSLRLSEESRDYTLTGRVSYRPIPYLALTLDPYYQSILNEGTVAGQAVPRNDTKTLNLGGGANVNLPVGSKARLTGTISRQFRSSRTTRYRSGVPEPAPRADYDYWYGILNLSWSL